jgi:hypothetical protein
MRYKILFIAPLLILLGFNQISPEERAKRQIKELKEGVLLVRLHTNDAVIAKLKALYEDKARVKKIEELYQQNLSNYKALSTAYNFSEILFFYGRDSDKVRNGELDNIFLNANLEIDTSIHLDRNEPFYILDIGDIYFDHISGHMEGVVVLNRAFEQLEKPFPFFVRKRSGMKIIKRTDLDVAVILNRELTEYYNKLFSGSLDLKE